MKTSRLILLTMLSVSMVFLSSCKDDEEPEVDPFVGEYVITKASISEPLELITNELGPDNPLTVPAGTDITAMIQAALLGEIECEPENTLIELREDYSIHFSCTTSMEGFSAGTWEEESETVLILYLNSTAVPPLGITLTVTDVELDGNKLKGTSQVPIPESMLAEIVALMSAGQYTLDTELTPDYLPLTFTIELTKQ